MNAIKGISLLLTFISVFLISCKPDMDSSFTSIPDQQIEPNYQLCEYFPDTNLVRFKFHVNELKDDCNGNFGKRSCYGDVLEGPTFTFNKNGTLIYHAFYDDGLITGIEEFYDDGNLIKRSFWIPEGDNKSTSLWTEFYEYHENAQLESITHFDANGKIQGSVVYFDSEGKLIRTENYCNGDLIEFKVNQCE
jgi:antitoxin component YwqK of YwqJK toxin-antitoxin module